MQDEPPVDPFLTQLCEVYTGAEAAEIEQYWENYRKIDSNPEILELEP